MSRTLDDSTVASNPGMFRLAPKKLKRLHPELYSRFLWMKVQNAHTFRAFLNGGADERIRLAEHLLEGDARAAVVVSVTPLLVAAYTDEINCVAMLFFPDLLVSEYALRPGTRLMTVNLYGDLRRNQYQEDLHPGPANSRKFGQFWPLIADFLTEDADELRAAKAQIAAEEWQLTERLGREYFENHGFFARDGHPRRSGRPATGRDGKSGHSGTCRPAPAGPRLVVRTGTQRLEAQGIEELRDLIARGDVRPEHQLLHPIRREWIPVEEFEDLR